MELVAWNAALIEDIRASAKEERSLFLYVDRETLGRLIGQQPEDALDDFCSAFRKAGGSMPFHRGAQSAVEWQERGFPGDPPFVVDLAMTVLAVTEVPLGNANGVYRRQNELLGLPQEAEPPPGYGDDVPQMWKVWNCWLEGPGRQLGVPSARPGHWTKQGWARSQGLVRHRDRLLVERFLEECPFSGVAMASELPLREWLEYRGDAGTHLLGLLDEPAAAEVVHEVVRDEEQRLQREGPRVGRVGCVRGLLHYDDWTRSFSGAVRVDPSWVGVPLDLGQAEPHVVDHFDDEILVVTLDTDVSELLGRGVERQLADGLLVRFGGDDVYVLRDEPSLTGRVQCRAVDTAQNCHVLVRDSRLPPVMQALRQAKSTAEPGPKVEGAWTWIEDVRIERDSPLLRALGLAALVHSNDGRARLEGGLPIGRGLYLVGSEPDLLLPAITTAVAQMDAQPLPLPEDCIRLALADRCPEPGDHVILYPGSPALKFRTVDFVHLRAVDGGVSWAGRRDGSAVFFSDPARDDPGEIGVSGAVLAGLPAVARPTVRRVGPIEHLILTEAGELLQVQPPTPRWLRRICLDPHAIDVVATVKTTPSRPVALLLRNTGNGKVTAISIPDDALLPAGEVPSVPRPDLVPELYATQWDWVGIADRHRAAEAMARAFDAGRGEYAARLRKNGKNGGPGRPHVVGRTVARDDIRRHALVDNPYDDVLTWLSELESGRTSVAQFAESWAWSCRHLGRAGMAGLWKRAVQTLTVMGHVERDFGRGQIATAPAALVDLPGVGGLSVLVGARPNCLLERMDDVEDKVVAVADAARCWELHSRTPVGFGGSPIGPTSVYVEWDPASRSAAEPGLTELAVSIQGCTATTLLGVLPSIEQTVKQAQPLSMSPGREPWLLEQNRGGIWEWVRQQRDTAAGLYRYQLAQGNSFAWRGSRTAPLVKMDPQSGHWLARAAAKKQSLLAHYIDNVLIVPDGVPLPALLARALTLRTGLPAHYLCDLRVEGHGRSANYWAYENIDDTVAQHVASLLGQHLECVYTKLGDD